MTEQIDNADDAAQDPAQDPPSGEKTFTQAQLDKIISNRLPEYEGLKSKAAQFDALTQSTEEALATAVAKADAAEAEVARRDVILSRQEIAATKGLDPKLWSRVKGETPDEIKADCDELLGIATLRPSKSPSAFRSGASNGEKLTLKEQAAAKLRELADNR